MNRRQYQDLLERDVFVIPDLYFDGGKLVVAEDQVACRLLFDCTPRWRSSDCRRMDGGLSSLSTCSTASLAAASPKSGR